MVHSCGHLDILATNYFDDFVLVGRKREARHLTSIVNSVFKLLGWAFVEDRPKAPEFWDVAQALGVRVDVSEMHCGKTWIDNTESRKSDLSSCIGNVLQTGELSTADALRLRGRMQFTSGQLFGRLSRAALSKVTHHAYRSCKARIATDLQIELSWYDTVLLSGKPRHECEFLAVTIALKSWKDYFVARQIVSFIDSNAARDSLISAKASGDIANRLLENVLSELRR